MITWPSGSNSNSARSIFTSLAPARRALAVRAFGSTGTAQRGRRSAASLMEPRASRLHRKSKRSPSRCRATGRNSHSTGEPPITSAFALPPSIRRTPLTRAAGAPTIATRPVCLPRFGALTIRPPRTKSSTIRLSRTTPPMRTSHRSTLRRPRLSVTSAPWACVSDSGASALTMRTARPVWAEPSPSSIGTAPSGRRLQG